MPTTNSIPPRLRLEEIESFRSLGHQACHILEFRGSVTTANAGTAVIQEHEDSDSLFVVLAGQLVVERASQSEIIALMNPGDLFGEMAVLNPPHSTASVIAREHTILWQLTRAQLRKFVSDHPEPGAALMKLLAQTFVDHMA